MNTVVYRGLLAAACAAISFAPLARAELPSLQPFQTLEPKPDETEFPELPAFAASLALAGNTLLVGMPGAFGDEGRVVIFIRNTAGTWVRRITLSASDAAPNADFGEDVAVANSRALVASDTGVYVFTSSGNTYLETQKLAFDGPVRILDLDWNGSIAIVGAHHLDTNDSAVYAFGLTSTGRLQRITKFTAHDAQPSDLFGHSVAIAVSQVAIGAPGYNGDQGAAYTYTCSLTACRERQKLLANDGEPGDEFGTSVDLTSYVLAVGAPGADPFYDENEVFRTSGAGYVFQRGTGPWVETQKLRPTADEAADYTGLGTKVAVSAQRVLVSAPFPLPGTGVQGTAFLYDWSGGSLIATHAMMHRSGYGMSLAISGPTAVVGAGFASPGYGFAEVFRLPPDIQ